MTDRIDVELQPKVVGDVALAAYLVCQDAGHKAVGKCVDRLLALGTNNEGRDSEGRAAC